MKKIFPMYFLLLVMAVAGVGYGVAKSIPYVSAAAKQVFVVAGLTAGTPDVETKAVQPAPVKVHSPAQVDLSECTAKNIEIRDGKIVLKNCAVIHPEEDQ